MTQTYTGAYVTDVSLLSEYVVKAKMDVLDDGDPCIVLIVPFPKGFGGFTLRQLTEGRRSLFLGTYAHDAVRPVWISPSRR